MQTDKKPSALSNELFDITKSFSNMSRSGQLYGRLNMIKDMQLYLVKEEVEVKEDKERSGFKSLSSSNENNPKQKRADIICIL